MGTVTGEGTVQVANAQLQIGHAHLLLRTLHLMVANCLMQTNDIENVAGTWQQCGSAVWQRSVAASSSSLGTVRQWQSVWQRVRHVASKCHKLRTQIGFVAATACNATSTLSSDFSLQSIVFPPPATPPLLSALSLSPTTCICISVNSLARQLVSGGV